MIAVRRMADNELAMVLSNWKKDMFARLERKSWGKMRPQDYWRLANHVLDRITIPSSRVYVGCNPDYMDAPLCWAAVRDGELLYDYYRQSVVNSPALFDMLTEQFPKSLPVVAVRIRDFNPFAELDR